MELLDNQTLDQLALTDLPIEYTERGLDGWRFALFRSDENGVVRFNENHSLMIRLFCEAGYYYVVRAEYARDKYYTTYLSGSGSTPEDARRDALNEVWDYIAEERLAVS